MSKRPSTWAGLLLVLACSTSCGAAQAQAAHGNGVIAYSVKTGIYTVRAGGSTPHLVIPWQPSTCGHDCVVWKVPRNPHYSPNGRYITYDLETYVVRHGEGGEADPNTRTVYIANADGSHIRRLGLGHHPEFTPNGTEVIYVEDPNAYGPLPLLEEPYKYYDEWAPLKAVNVLTGAARSLPLAGDAEYSADGDMLLGTRQVREDGGIRWTTTLENADGTNLRNLTLHMFYAESSRFMANGSISYDCPATDRQQPDICVFDPATGHRIRLFHVHEFWALQATNSTANGEIAVSGLQGLYVTDRTGNHARWIVHNGHGPSYISSDVPITPVWVPQPSGA